MSLVDITEHAWSRDLFGTASRCERCGFSFNSRDGIPDIPKLCWTLPELYPERADFYRDALEAVLLFHSANPWTPEKRARWATLTGEAEATTRALCDAVRRALG